MKLPPFDKPTPRLPEEAAAPPDAELSEQLNKTIKDINSKVPALRPAREVDRFVSLGQQLTQAMRESARGLLAKAENKCKEIEARADEIDADIKRRWAEIEELTKVIEGYSGSMLDSHEKYISEVKKK